MIGVRFPSEAGSFYVHHRSFQTGSGAHSASYPNGTGFSFPGLKRPGRKADIHPPPSAEVKNAWNYTYTPAVRIDGVVIS